MYTICVHAFVYLFGKGIDIKLVNYLTKLLIIFCELGHISMDKRKLVLSK